MNRITPSYVGNLKSEEVFVFGSNLSGAHGGGAANLAQRRFGAKHGVGIGPTGQCYAIPTKDYNVADSLPLASIEVYVDDFINYAKKKKDLIFLVTEIGCGLAGFTPAQIAPMFKDALNLENVYLPQRFVDVLT